MNEVINGNLIIIGGAEDKEGKKEILKRVCQSINKDRDSLVVATVASEDSKKVAEKYQVVFRNLGVKNINILDITTREDSYKEENIKVMKEAKLIFFTGGDQLRITSLVGGTPVYNELKDLVSKGIYIVGTSAGASVMSDTMILEGEDEEAPMKSSLKMSPGFGLIKSTIIDQHFDQRGRIGRLLTGVAQNPEVLGIGIDEDTAIIVSDKGVAQVIGTGAVYFIDGSKIFLTNVSKQKPTEVLSIYGIQLHVLKEGNKFDLIRKEPFKEEIIKNENNR